MDSQACTKVRRVRCPRCWKVLEEFPDMSLYSCGGCGNILQAKNRNLESNCAEGNSAKSQEADVLEEKESGSSIHASTGPPSIESSPDKVDSLEVILSKVEEKELFKQVNLEGHVPNNCEIDYSAKWAGGSSSDIPSSGEFSKSIENVEQQEREDDFGDAVRDLQNLEDLARDPLENGLVFLSHPIQDSEKEAAYNGLDSYSGIASHENDLEPLSIPIITNLEEDKNLVIRDSKVTSQRSLAESLATCYHTCPEDEQSLMEKPSKLSGITSERNLKQRLITNPSTDEGYYSYGGINRGPDRNCHARFLHRPVKSSRQWDNEKYVQTTGYASEINMRRRDKSLLPPRPRFSPSSKASYLEMDKVELLRTVHELKDQLNRIQFPTNRGLPSRTLKGKFNSFNYDRLSGCTGNYNTSRMAFSGEDFMHCSAQFHEACSYCPGSELSMSRYETTPDEVNKRFRLQERNRAGIRHVRPTAGAAPFLACYHCSKLLHLPADFLIFKNRRCHRLMCSACKKVLKFAIMQGSRIVPYVPEASSAPPPSEADNGYSRRLEVARSFSKQGGMSSRVPKWRKSTSDVREDHRLHHLMGYSSPSQVYD